MNQELGFKMIPFKIDPEFKGEMFEEESEVGRSRLLGAGGSRSFRQRSPSGPRSRGTKTYPIPRPWPNPRPWEVIREPYGLINDHFPGEPDPSLGSEQTRWVQDCLNQIMKLQLPVNGVMGPETRSALRSFQQKQGLQASGIVSPRTEQALGAACEAGQDSRAASEEMENFWEILPGNGELEMEFEAGTVPPACKPALPARTAASPVRKYPPFSLEPFLLRALGRLKPRQELEFFGGFSELEGELTGARLTTAVAANRRLARQLGWGCVVNDRLQLNETPPPNLYRVLGLGDRPSEEDFAQAVEQFQLKELGPRSGDGQLGQQTLNLLHRRGAFPVTTFAPFSKPVIFGGRKLGVLDKTRAYEKCFFDPANNSPCRAARSGIAGEGGGAIIELGFRVTDLDAVRRAGFVDVFGEPFFRWIQVVEFITVPAFNPAGGLTGFVRRASGEVDPMAVAGIPTEQLDLHPYYWDEVTHSGASPGLNVDQWVNRRAQNGLCYDLIFQDRATFPLSTVSPPAPWTRPGSHAYFNFELALVGVRPGPPIQNFVLFTLGWGYDIFMKGGQPNVDLNGLKPGPTDGSPFLKKILNREFNRDDVPFPGHCMAGSGYTGRANCKK